jgi:SpoVK/Ycf46/Vps4 family AAA+-type ATPase
VVLIDEADIFLEKRTTTQIDRNAVVGTFLRVLEYYNGVLFLTTNRVHDFDEAFYSRYHRTPRNFHETLFQYTLIVNKNNISPPMGDFIEISLKIHLNFI